MERSHTMQRFFKRNASLVCHRENLWDFEHLCACVLYLKLLVSKYVMHNYYTYCSSRVQRYLEFAI